MAIQDDLLEILVCPLSKAQLVYDSETDKLISTDKVTRRRYSIDNDIPVMLVDDEHSEQLSEGEWGIIMRAHDRADVI
jgi:uncharacterized protein